MHQRDRRTDRRTDTGRQQRPRLRIASRGKNPRPRSPSQNTYRNTQKLTSVKSAVLGICKNVFYVFIFNKKRVFNVFILRWTFLNLLYQAYFVVTKLQTIANMTFFIHISEEVNFVVKTSYGNFTQSMHTRVTINLHSLWPSTNKSTPGHWRVLKVHRFID